ncbi:MAG: GtrA family protein [Clostridia bacterium]|nr:GtrA family protein [Clostridia bacterium]
MKKLYFKAMELYKKYKEIFWYLAVGGLTTLVGYGTKAIFYSLCGFDAGTSTALSWVCAVLFAYPTNKILVFEHKAKNLFLEFFSFVASRVATGVFDYFFMMITVDIFEYNFYVMMIISSVVVLVLNYVFSKLITFRKKKEDNAPASAEENAEITAGQPSEDEGK